MRRETDEPGSNDRAGRIHVLALWGKIEPLKNPTPKQTNATITTLRFMIPSSDDPCSILNYVTCAQRNRLQLITPANHKILDVVGVVEVVEIPLSSENVNHGFCFAKLVLNSSGNCDCATHFCAAPGSD